MSTYLHTMFNDPFAFMVYPVSIEKCRAIWNAISFFPNKNGGAKKRPSKIQNDF